MLPQFLHFPWLHPELISQNLPSGTALLDPGIAVLDSSVPRWRPHWPFSDAQVARLVAEYHNLMAQSARPSDVAAYLAVGVENFYADTAMEIRSQLRDQGQRVPAEENHWRQAQILLALELVRESALVDMARQEMRLREAQRHFQEGLGVEADDFWLPKGDWDLRGEPLDWRPLFGAMDRVVPAQIPFVVSDPAVVGVWLDSGIPFERDPGGLGWCVMDDGGLRALGLAPLGSVSRRKVALILETE